MFTWRFIPESPVRSPGKVNWLAAALMSVGICCVLIAIAQTTVWGWVGSKTLALLAVGLLCCAVWIAVEVRGSEPLIDMAMMRIRGVGTTNLAAFLLGAGMYSSFIVIPQFAQLPKRTGFGFGASIVVSSLYLLPSALGMGLVGIAAGRVARRFGSKSALVVGTAITALAFAFAAVQHRHPHDTLTTATVLGIGIGLAFAALGNLIVQAVPTNQTGVASGVPVRVRVSGAACPWFAAGGRIAEAGRAPRSCAGSRLTPEGRSPTGDRAGGHDECDAVHGVLSVGMSRHRRHKGSAFASLALAIVLIAAPEAGASDIAPRVAISPPGSPLAAVPYMGWNTYYGVGGVFDEKTIRSAARSLLHLGLASAGYRIVWLDFGWARGNRNSRGEILVSHRQWPHGLPWLTAWLHRHGLLAGIYTDAGASGCDRKGVGSLGHYRQDANTFAAWGFDAVKVDFCGAGQERLKPQPAYAGFARALARNSSHKHLLLNVCNFWVPGQINGKRPSFANSAFANYRWAPRVAQSWRTDTDIGFTGKIEFVNVLRNLDRDAAHPAAARPGHWNDPDYLGPGLGMTRAEARAQLSMWAIVAAPLILGSDPRALSSATIKMLTNRQVLAIDQDPLGIQGTAIEQQRTGQVWSKRLLGGDRAVALLNRGSQALRITVRARRTGLPEARRYSLKNLWSHTSKTTAGVISARVPPHSVVLYRVTPI